MLKNILKTIIRKLNGRLTITPFFPKMIYTPLRGKRNLVEIYLTFLSYLLILTQSILMKVERRDQILLLSHVPVFMIQQAVKIGKFGPLLTHLFYIFQNLNGMVKLRTLRPLQAQPIMIVPNKYLNQARTLKLHVNRYHNHQRSRVITFQRLRSTIPQPKVFRKPNLVILKAENTTYFLILILITQKYTVLMSAKIYSSPFCLPFSLFTFILSVFGTHHSNLFFFGGAFTYHK